MAKLIPLQQPAPAALARYRSLLAPPIDAYSALVPLDALLTLERDNEASLRPAQSREVNLAVAALGTSLKIPGAIVEPEKFGEVMAIELAGYPADILKEAVGHARRTLDWFPSIKEMIAICERLIEPRRNQYRAIWQMKAEHRRRQQETAERKTEAEREAESEMEREAQRQRLRDLEVQACERLGDDAPLPGDLELADSLSKPQVYRVGKPISWLAALAEGELWAAKYCRQMALAERAKRALEQGRVPWVDALAATKLIVTDEESARRQINVMMDHPVKYPRDRPTESFWRALCRIVRACGLDAPLFPEDRAAAAIDNLKHIAGLAALADVGPILDRQVREEWEARRAARMRPAMAWDCESGKKEPASVSRAPAADTDGGQEHHSPGQGFDSLPI
jgi:hypothetical protein